MTRPGVSFIFLMASTLAFAQDKSAVMDAVTYVGRWDFKNSQSGQTFGGDMKIVLQEKQVSSEPDVDVFKGKLSFDGRETNDKCGTVSTFGKDTPVDVLWEQKGDDVVLSYKVPCPTQDPRVVTKRFTARSDGIVREYSLQWGKGLEKLLKQ